VQIGVKSLGCETHAPGIAKPIMTEDAPLRRFASKESLGVTLNLKSQITLISLCRPKRSRTNLRGNIGDSGLQMHHHRAHTMSLFHGKARKD